MPAIVTLTMNPAVDISTTAERVRTTDKVRCGEPCYDPGGGGINVARIVRVLGETVVAVFPVGSATGAVLGALLDREGVWNRRVPIAGATRESFTVDERSSGEQYRFVLPGPHLSRVEQEQCLSSFAEVARDARYVVASGSLPPGTSPDFYDRVAATARDVGARCLLDTSGESLRHSTSGVYLLKPSIRELRELSGRSLGQESEQIAAARGLVTAGRCEVVIVSLGARGALMVTQSTATRFPAIPVAVRSGVGAGDAMLAGIAVGLVRNRSLHDAVRLGIAAGAAMLTTPGTRACRREDIEAFYDGGAGASVDCEPVDCEPVDRDPVEPGPAESGADDGESLRY
ncbi:1-phosphofructokinase family hexose kinase [Prescottella equi]|uniref:1-phosphofructokinase family hexose kinase n=1 Tax=Rhodococcus hoagii TaxID=43767 RepID=UPI0019F883F8|nr:1-phosphofructokinase family hexose kinase [Prescottella equi]NKR43244.1 hexose kinase [Prescottella equi]NKR70739.1 hexose kinase [Prescottella equi]